MDDTQEFHQTFIPTDAIADGVAKRGKEEAPDVTGPRPSPGGCLHDRSDGGLDFIEKLPAKIAALVFEIARGLDQLDLKGRVKPTVHESAARALRKTSA